MAACLCLAFCINSTSQVIREHRQFPMHRLPSILKAKWEIGKPALIEVFSSSCSIGFSILPTLKEIKDSFGESLQVFLIGASDGSFVNTYERFASWYKLNFSIAFDTGFYRLFNTGFLPTFLWVDANGIVQALTGNIEVTSDNVKNLVSGRTIYRQQILPAYTLTGFLTNSRNSNLIIRSELTEWAEPEPTSLPLSVSSKKNYFQALGATLKQLYFYAFVGKVYWSSNDSLYGNFSKTILIDSIKSRINVDWNKRFSYRLAFSENPSYSSFLRAMQLDLERSLSFSADIELRIMPYWKLIVKNGDTTQLSTRYTESIGSATHDSIDLKNHSMNTLIQILHRYYPHDDPIIDETGIKGNVDLKIVGVLEDRYSLMEALKKTGLELVPGKKLMKVIVLRPK